MADIAALGAVLAIVGMWVFKSILLRLLRIRRPDYVERLASSRSHWRKPWRLFVFLWSGESFRLNDPVIASVGAAWLACGVGAVGFLVALLSGAVK